MGRRTLLAFIVLSASVAALVLPPDGHAYKRMPFKGRPGNITVEVAWGTFGDNGVPHFRLPDVTIQRASSPVFQQEICVARRVWKYTGGSYEPLKGWTVDWHSTRCGAGSSVRFPPLWIDRTFGAVHFDMLIGWRNPSTREVIATERVDWDQVSNYRCLNPGPSGNCQPGVLFGGVAGIQLTF